MVASAGPPFFLRSFVQVKRADGDDDSICRMIVEKLADLPSVSYADIAQTAHRVGRVQLATKVGPGLAMQGQLGCAPMVVS